jgi:hypothetical protein
MFPALTSNPCQRSAGSKICLWPELIQGLGFPLTAGPSLPIAVPREFGREWRRAAIVITVRAI